MENLFLAIIAVNALLGAIIMGGLLFGMRQVNKRLDLLEAEVDREVMPKLQEFVALSRRIADAAADARRRVTRADAVVTARADQVHALVGGTLDRVSGVAETAAAYTGRFALEGDEEYEDEEEAASR
ncbi:MAG TPA: hypothetical protein VIG50_11645 [Vicinamibacteria bacterium]|jgi:hypothetical protein